jgi:CTP-dependent riboflavin kinase
MHNGKDGWKIRNVILRTDKADSEPKSRSIIEVACEVKLRDNHELNDGDVVEVKVAD